MTGFKPGLAACLVLLILCGAGAAACAAEQTDASRRGGAANDSAAQQGSVQATVPGQAPERVREDEMQVLAEGIRGRGSVTASASAE